MIPPGSSPASSGAEGRGVLPKDTDFMDSALLEGELGILMNSLGLLKHLCFSSVCLSSSQDG